MTQYIEAQPLFATTPKTGLAAWFEGFKEQRRLAREVKRTFNELDNLRDRELADLGIMRADIAKLAYDSVHNV